MSRRAGALVAIPVLVLASTLAAGDLPEARPHVAMRGIYGGVPQEVLDSGRGLKEFGVTAVWLGHII